VHDHPHTDATVHEFYAHRGGARMFSADSLTPPVAAYLRDEMSLLEGDPDFSHLFEVGCGQGLHLSWATARGLRYDGLDLVAWPRDRDHSPADLLTSSPLRCRLHVGSAEDLYALWTAEGLVARRRSIVILFPFNCFGILARPEKTVAQVARTGARLYLSVFSADPEATARRLEFYAHSGYTDLRAHATARGSLITSAEGLYSWAYDERHVIDLLSSEGYACVRRVALAQIGAGLLFSPQAAGGAEAPRDGSVG